MRTLTGLLIAGASYAAIDRGALAAAERARWAETTSHPLHHHRHDLAAATEREQREKAEQGRTYDRQRRTHGRDDGRGPSHTLRHSR